MPKKIYENSNTLAWVAILGVLVIGLLAYNSTGGFKSVGGASYTPPGGGVCPTAPATTGYPRIAYIAGYQDQANNGKNTTAAITWNLTQSPSLGFALQIGAGSTISYTNTTSQGLQCGKSYIMIFGAGGSATNYYPGQITIGPLNATQTTVPFVALQKEAQILSPLFSNSTNFNINYTTAGGVNSITPGTVVVAGSTYSNLYFTNRAGNGAYGGSGIQYLLMANTVALGKVNLNVVGGGAVPSGQVVYASTANVPAGFTVYAFQGAPITVWNAQQQFQVVVTTTSSFHANTPILLAINDLPGTIQNGALIFPAGGVDPNSHADLGQPLTMMGSATEAFINSASYKAPFSLCYSASGAAGCSG